MTDLGWRKHFPLPEPRAEQVQFLDWACEQFVAGHRRVVGECGTGVGKSAIAVTLGRWLEERESGRGDFNPGATVLTSQKSLQDQYTRDFREARDLRSSSNFSCDGPVGGTCGETSRVRKAIGLQLAQEKLKCGMCPYRCAKDDFVDSLLGVTNYSFHLNESTYAGEIPPRRLLVLDEAHNVEDQVRSWASVEVTEGDAKRLGLDLADAEGNEVAWLEEVYRPAIQKMLEKTARKLKKFVRAGSMGTNVVRDLANDNDTQDKRLCQVNRLAKAGELLTSWSEDRRGHRYLRFQPVDVTDLCEEALYSRPSAVLLLSATLLDRDVFLKSVGLVGAPYLSAPTTFSPEQFGVHFRPVGKMTMDKIDASLKKLPNAIRRILRENPTQKGIVHTMNYKITRALKEALGGEKRLIFQDSAADRNSILERHMGSPEPTVIVSPSMMEGLDLRDDLGRFQVVCKVPYPDMTDPLVKRKDREWYNWRTVRTLVQAVGRSVRSSDDWCKTMIMDESFLNILEWAGHMLPRHLSPGGMIVEEP